MRRAGVLASFIGFFALLVPGPGYAGTFSAFGPETFTRGSGEPVVATAHFGVPDPNTTYTLRILNGLEDGEAERVSSSVISLNGTQVVGPSEFNQGVHSITYEVSLGPSNELSVEVRGKPGGTVTVEIIGVDNGPPSITAVASPPPNSAGWNNEDVTVTFDCADALSGIAVCPDPEVVSTEGAAQIISGTAIDRAGNSATTSVTLNIDKTPPLVTITSPPNLSTVTASPITVTGTVDDGNATVEVNAVQAVVGGGIFTAEGIALDEGANTLTATATDQADNVGTSSIEVVLESEAGETVTVVIGSAGGVVSLSTVSLEIPAGALPTGTEITLESLTSADLPGAILANEVLLGAVRLEPHGLTFDSPSTLTFTLPEARPPGGRVSVFLYDPANGGQTPETEAVVAANGLTASVEIQHFSILAVIAPSGAVCELVSDFHCPIPTGCVPDPFAKYWWECNGHQVTQKGGPGAIGFFGFCKDDVAIWAYYDESREPFNESAFFTNSITDPNSSPSRLTQYHDKSFIFPTTVGSRGILPLLYYRLPHNDGPNLFLDRVVWQYGVWPGFDPNLAHDVAWFSNSCTNPDPPGGMHPVWPGHSMSQTEFRGWPAPLGLPGGRFGRDRLVWRHDQYEGPNMPPYIDGYYSNSITNPVFPPNLFTQSDGFPYLWLDVLPETNVARWMRLESNLAGDIVPRYYCNHVDSTDPPLRFDLDNPPLLEECFPGLQAQMSISEESRVTGIPILVYDNDGNVAASLSCMNADETLSQYWVLDSDPLTGRATLTWLDEEGAGAISGTFDPATNRFRFSSHEPPERSFDSGGVTFFTQFSETIEGLYDVGTQTISGTWRVRDTNSWTLSDGTVSCSAILSFEGDVLAGAP